MRGPPRRAPGRSSLIARERSRASPLKPNQKG
jgi:hypothetical protein